MNRLVNRAFLVGLVAVTGCSDSGSDMASDLGADVREMASDLDEGKVAVVEAIAALKKIDGSGDLKSQFSDYVENVDDLDEVAADLRDLRGDVEKRHGEYTASWQQRQTAIQDAELRRKSEERRKALETRFESLRSMADSTRAAFDLLMKDLRDIQKFLEDSLNAAGVESVRTTATGAATKAENVTKGIDALSAELKKVADELEAR